MDTFLTANDFPCCVRYHAYHMSEYTNIFDIFVRYVDAVVTSALYVEYYLLSRRIRLAANRCGTEGVA